MRNPDLYRNLRDYCKAALALIAGSIKRPEDIPTMMREKVKCTGPGSFSFYHETETLWPALVYKNDAGLKELQPYKAARQCLEKDAIVSKHLNSLVGTPESKVRMDVDRILLALLTQLVNKQDGTQFDDERFGEIYNSLEDFFYEDRLEYRCFAAMERFSMDTDRIELEPNLFIGQIPQEDKERILSEAKEFGSFVPFPLLLGLECALELRTSVRKIIGDAGSEAVEDFPSRSAQAKFDDVCSALRLFKGGAVGYNRIRVESLSWGPHGGAFSLGPNAPKIFSGSPYKLIKDEAESFADFWTFFQGIRKSHPRRVEVALRRLDFAYERARPEDKLVDYLIGFEALLLKRSERQELEYRLALRGSYLLADDLMKGRQSSTS